MPKIGMRIIKSAIAVFICFLISMIRGQGIVFYSAIAAILCMQPYVSNSLKVAKNRIVGTLIGGIFGMIVLIVQRAFIPTNMMVLNYLFISIAIIPLIYITVIVEKPSASYITCVVFLSVTVAHGIDVSIYEFALNRILDTLIGIVVSLGVNAFHMPKEKNSDVLFISGLDGTLINDNEKITSYSKVKLNQILSRGGLFTVATSRTPATVTAIMKDVEIKLPIIVMNGAALYDIGEKRYMECKYIDTKTSSKIMKKFEEYHCNCFVHTVINDILHIYYGDFNNSIEEKFYNDRKFLPMQNYIYGDIPKNIEALYFIAIDNAENIKSVYDSIKGFQKDGEISMSYYEYLNNKGYYVLEVYSSRASKYEGAKTIKQIASADFIVAFGKDMNDESLIENSDYSYAVEGASHKIKEKAHKVIGPCQDDSVVKTISKLFYSKKFFHRKN